MQKIQTTGVCTMSIGELFKNISGLLLAKNCFSFVDRDMVMRFYWGLGVGHTYSHQSQQMSDIMLTEGLVKEELKEEDQTNEEEHKDEEDGEDMGSGLGMEDRENENWMDEDSDIDEGDGDVADEYGDAEFLERYQMYGLQLAYEGGHFAR